MPKTEHRAPVGRIELPPRNSPPLSTGEWRTFLQSHAGMGGVDAAMWLFPKIATERKTAPRYSDGRAMHSWPEWSPCWLFARDVGRWLDTAGISVFYADDLPGVPVETAASLSPSPVPRAAPATAMPSPGPVSGSLLHSTKGKRRDSLSVRIEEAQGKCRDPFDAVEVWTVLCEMATHNLPPGPLMGVEKGNLMFMRHVGYPSEHFTLMHLKQRLKRQQRKQAPAL